MHAVTAIIWIKKKTKNKGFKKHNVQETVVELNKIVHDKAEKFIKLLVYFTAHWLFVIVTHQVCWVGKQGVTMAHLLQEVALVEGQINPGSPKEG